jgi:hypothetical protein
MERTQKGAKSKLRILKERKALRSKAEIKIQQKAASN